MATDSGDDQRLLLAALAQGGVEFVLIGGHAIAAHGFARGTRDVDIVFATSAESCARLARALADVGASIVVADLPAPGGRITAGWLADGGRFIFSTRYGTLAAFSWVAGNDYAALDSRGITVRLAEGTTLRVCGYDDLIAMKERARRPKDEEDLRNLRALDVER
ncbi:MAG: hypothetical protein ACR2GL_01600 [Thermoleophilaceae bacterium]